MKVQFEILGWAEDQTCNFCNKPNKSGFIIRCLSNSMPTGLCCMPDLKKLVRARSNGKKDEPSLFDAKSA